MAIAPRGLPNEAHTLGLDRDWTSTKAGPARSDCLGCSPPSRWSQSVQHDFLVVMAHSPAEFRAASRTGSVSAA
jgi:hypothetical protein